MFAAAHGALHLATTASKNTACCCSPHSRCDPTAAAHADTNPFQEVTQQQHPAKAAPRRGAQLRQIDGETIRGTETCWVTLGAAGNMIFFPFHLIFLIVFLLFLSSCYTVCVPAPIFFLPAPSWGRKHCGQRCVHGKSRPDPGWARCIPLSRLAARRASRHQPPFSAAAERFSLSQTGLEAPILLSTTIIPADPIHLHRLQFWFLREQYQG